MRAQKTGTIEKTEIDTTTLFGSPHNVILFNDENHSFQEVVLQVIKAIKCTLEKAYKLTLEAHEKGEAVVFSGSKERCEHVDSILAGPPASLRTDIRKA